MTFTPDSDHAVLVLAYRRPEGQVRTEGYVDLRQVLLLHKNEIAGADFVRLRIGLEIHFQQIERGAGNQFDERPAFRRWSSA